MKHLVDVYLIMLKKAGPSDWGTCLHRTCLNPELKIEKLIQEKLTPSINLEYVIQNDDDYHDLLENIKLLEKNPSNLKINCVEWNLVSHKGKSRKETKISRKEVSSFHLCDFAKKLAIELAVLKDHLYRAHMQYRAAFKTKTMEAKKSSDTVTFQINWYENASICQAQEVKSAYYHTDQISIHCIHSWSSQGQESFDAISDQTDHKASAVFASLEPILLKYCQANAHHFNIISDSPTSQYRNKNVFWFMSKFFSLKNVSIDWIYLEAGKGKGTADGIGAVVKRAFTDIILQHPDSKFESVTDFLQYLLSYIQSVEVFHFTKEDVMEKRNIVPGILSIKGTGKCH